MFYPASRHVTWLYCVFSFFSFFFLGGDKQLSKGSSVGCDRIVWSRNDQQIRSTEEQPKQRDRKKQMVFNKHTARTVFEISSVSLTTRCVSVCVCVSVCPSGPCLRVIKILLCWYVNTCTYSLILCVLLSCSGGGGGCFHGHGLSHLCTTKAGLLGDWQDQLLIRKLNAVETAGLGSEEESTVI